MTYTPLGDLVQGRSGVIGFGVANTSANASSTVSATVTLPPGVSYVGTGSLGSPFTGLGVRVPRAIALDATDGWTCAATVTGGSCTHPALPGGASTRAYIQVQAAPGSAGDVPVTVTVTADGLDPVTVTGSRGVRADGLGTRYAASGPLTVTEIGNALLSCPTTAAGCADARARRGDKLDDDDWAMTWYATDTTAKTQSSSAAVLSLPAAAHVRWAGLYWSGFSTGATSGTLRVRGPGSTEYTTVPAARTDTSSESNQPVFQSYADVTALVQAGGAGTWWAADSQVRQGKTFYGGWSLVVVADDPAAKPSQVTVLDGLSAVTTGGTPQQILVPGEPGSAARIGAVLWEGDANITGDSLSVDGTPLTPDGGTRNATNVADSSANGAVGLVNTLGTDVDSFTTAFPPGSDPVVTASTVGDTYFVGVLTVTSG